MGQERFTQLSYRMCFSLAGTTSWKSSVIWASSPEEAVKQQREGGLEADGFIMRQQRVYETEVQEAVASNFSAGERRVYSICQGPCA